jgi:hypothetical protein
VKVKENTHSVRSFVPGVFVFCLETRKVQVDDGCPEAVRMDEARLPRQGGALFANETLNVIYFTIAGREYWRVFLYHFDGKNICCGDLCVYETASAVDYSGYLLSADSGKCIRIGCEAHRG